MQNENMEKNLKTAALFTGIGIAFVNDFFSPGVNFREQTNKMFLVPVVISRPAEVSFNFLNHINQDGGGTEMASNLALFNLTTSSTAGVVFRPDGLSPLNFYPINTLWPEYAEVRKIKSQDLTLKS